MAKQDSQRLQHAYNVVALLTHQPEQPPDDTFVSNWSRLQETKLPFKTHYARTMISVDEILESLGVYVQAINERLKPILEADVLRLLNQHTREFVNPASNGDLFKDSGERDSRNSMIIVSNEPMNYFFPRAFFSALSNARNEILETVSTRFREHAKALDYNHSEEHHGL